MKYNCVNIVFPKIKGLHQITFRAGGMNLSKNKKASNLLFISIIIAYIIWAGIFILKTSIIAVDGNRYFSLFDDAMISMRYAWNFSHGNGLVWNPGERVEGYTNFLMTLIMSIATLLFNEKYAVLAVQVFGILTVILIVWQARKLYQLVAEDNSTPLLSNIFPVSVILYYPLSYWPLMGMETGLVTLFLLLSLNAIIRFDESDENSQLFLSALFASLSYLTRMDAVLIVPPIMLFLLTRSAGWKQRFLNCIKFGLVALILPLMHMAFRYLYYGELMPNTYYLKLTGLATTDRLRAGLRFTYPFLTSTLPLWIFAGLNTILNINRRKLMLFTSAVLFVIYQIWVGGDAWSYWRMVTPIVPMTLILFLNEFYAFIQVAIQSLLTPTVKSFLNRRPVWSVDIPLIKKISRRDFSRILMTIGLAIILLLLLADVAGIGKAGFGYTQQLSIITAVVLILFSWLVGASDQSYSSRTHTVFFALGIAAVLIYANLRFIPQMVFYAPPYQTSSNRSGINLSVAINEVTDPQARVGVFWAGTLPYYTHRYAVDFLGKSDTHIAHLTPLEGTTVSTLPGHNKFDLTYSILNLQPDYVPGFAWGGEDITEEAGPLYIQAEYKGVEMFLFKESNFINWDLVTIDPQ